MFILLPPLPLKIEYNHAPQERNKKKVFAASLAIEKQMSSAQVDEEQVLTGETEGRNSQLPPRERCSVGKEKKKKTGGRNASLTLPWQLSSSSEAALSRSSRPVMLTQSCAALRGRHSAARKAVGEGMRPNASQPRYSTLHARHPNIKTVF